ncbi:MAG: transposase [Epsilonproteobacteria bacterium]|nr:transposase [Campylobacterota bacterium]
MRKSFKYKLYRSKKNRYLDRLIIFSGVIYNHCIALHKRYFKLTGKYLNPNRLKTHLTKLKKIKKYEFYRFVPSQAIQDIVERIDRGYKLFFKYQKDKSVGLRYSPPSFKKTRKYKSFTLKQAGYKLLDGNRIKIGDKMFKFSKSRDIIGAIKTVTIKRDALGDFYITFSCDNVEPQTIKPMTGKSAGFDFGLKTFLTCSDGIVEINSPLVFTSGLKEIRRANKAVSRKKIWSNSRRKAVVNLARIHKLITYKRRDFHFKLANKLVCDYDYLFFEDLNISAMKKLWGRKVSDLGFSDFLNIVGHKCSEYGKKMSTVDRFFPSTKTCNMCKNVNKSMGFKDLSNREWICPSCGVLLHRDRNAARNILEEGIRRL